MDRRHPPRRIVSRDDIGYRSRDGHDGTGEPVRGRLLLSPDASPCPGSFPLGHSWSLPRSRPRIIEQAVSEGSLRSGMDAGPDASLPLLLSERRGRPFSVAESTTNPEGGDANGRIQRRLDADGV